MRISDNWKLHGQDPEKARDPRVQALMQEALAAAPLDYLSHPNPVALLPRRATTGVCRLCGATGTLTKEHLPPKSSGNKQRTRAFSMDDWLRSTDVAGLPGGAPQQGGIFGFTLCGECNSLTGARYGDQYRCWAAEATSFLDGLANPAELNRLQGPFGYPVKFGETGDLCPGGFVRQVLSCMCSLSGEWELAAHFPALRRIILEGWIEPLPEQLALGLALYYGPRVRIAGPQLRLDADKQEWRWLMELAYPPFALGLVVASNLKEPGLGLMIGDWTQEDPSKAASLEGVVECGFGWTPYPLDYRSQARIAAEAGNTAIASTA